jgi:invasion protein IalB
MQFVTAEDRENVGLTVIVLKTADGEARILRVLAPLGVLLPRGLGLRIDEEDLGSAGFVRCLPNGCVAEVIMDDALIEKLSSGATATFVIFQTPEEGIGIPITLEGFREAYAALPQPGAGSAQTGGAAAPAQAPAAGTDAAPAAPAEPAPQ